MNEVSRHGEKSSTRDANLIDFTPVDWTKLYIADRRTKKTKNTFHFTRRQCSYSVAINGKSFMKICMHSSLINGMTCKLYEHCNFLQINIQNIVFMTIFFIF